MSIMFGVCLHSICLLKLYGGIPNHIWDISLVAVFFSSNFFEGPRNARSGWQSRGSGGRHMNGGQSRGSGGRHEWWAESWQRKEEHEWWAESWQRREAHE